MANCIHCGTLLRCATGETRPECAICIKKHGEMPCEFCGRWCVGGVCETCQGLLGQGFQWDNQ